MKIEKLIFHLKYALPNYLDFEWINAGGCGVVALHLAKALEELELYPKIVWISQSNDTEKFKKLLTYSEATLQYLYDNDINCCHCIVKLDNYYIDSTGVYKSLDETRWGDYYYKELAEISIEELEPLVQNPIGWNDFFDRNLIPQVIERINYIKEESKLILNQC